MHVEPEPFREHRLGNDQPVRDRDDHRCAEVEARLGPRRLERADPEPLCRCLRRRRDELSPAAGRRVGSRENARDLMSRGEPFEDVGAERRGRCDRDRPAQRAPRTGCGLSLASAARRDSSSVRSMISTPSRWSSSCWTTRDAGSSSSNVTGSPFVSTPSIVTDVARSTGTSTSRSERQPSSSISRVLRALRDRRIDEHAILALVHEDEQPPQDADLRCGEPDPVRLVHELGHALDEPLEIVVEGLHLARLHAEHRVAVLADPREREEPPRLALDLLVLLGVVVLVVAVIVVVRGRDRGSWSAIARRVYRRAMAEPSASDAGRSAGRSRAPPASMATQRSGRRPCGGRPS